MAVNASFNRCDCHIHATDEKALSWKKSRELDLLSVAVSAGSFSTQPVILINPPARPEVCYCLFQAQQAVSWEKLIILKFSRRRRVGKLVCFVFLVGAVAR